MSIKLTHSYRLYADPKEFLKGCTTFNSLARRIDKGAEETAKITGCVQGTDSYNKEMNDYKGGMFELFCEFLIRAFPYDKRIGISSLTMVDGDGDTGVDAFGIGSNGKPATAQMKYRQANYTLNANDDHVDRIITASQNKYGISVEEAQNMVIITSGKGVHFFTESEMLYNKVRCINREMIQELVDDNLPFWEGFCQAWENSLPKISKNP